MGPWDLSISKDNPIIVVLYEGIILSIKHTYLNLSANEFGNTALSFIISLGGNAVAKFSAVSHVSVLIFLTLLMVGNFNANRVFTSL